MPALEILDFSKNELSSLPELPGHLVKLKVLSLTSNKIQTLPSYLVGFGVLKVFKVDQNPVEWPVCYSSSCSKTTIIYPTLTCEN